MRRPSLTLRRLALLALLLALPAAPAPLAAQAIPFANMGFDLNWKRYDAPVQLGQASRSWTWGPTSLASLNEPYAETPGGQRQVQYFDKARMELNNPATPQSVTNGLLVRELVGGFVAVGDSATQPSSPAQQTVSGDPVEANPAAPTYASFRGVASLNNDNRAPDRTGQTVNQRIDKAGAVSPLVGGQLRYAYFEPTLGHNIPDVLWTFLNQSGPLYFPADGKIGPVDKVYDPWQTVVGLPIAEPYWTTTNLAGQPTPVLVQLFERRVLTYTPSNPANAQVEMGNVGQAYYAWRYGSAPPAPPVGPATPYLDDRSDPVQVVLSHYSAVNRKEYARAYSYWEENAPQRPPFDQFRQGYADTAAVTLTTGQVGGDAGAGQFYYTVPVVIVATTTAGATQTFAGCSTLHLSNPSIQGPPFKPMGIQTAAIQTAAAGADPAALLAAACQGPSFRPTSPVPPRPAPDPADIGAARYLDDRSDPVQVIRSLYNAVNRKEYARAYAYWQATDQLPVFDQFEQGYAQTQSVQLTTGAATGDPGAGQLNYTVPAAIAATMADGTTTSYAGCYRLHLTQPALQEQPPYQPLGITGADIQPVADAAAASARLAQGCP